MFQLIYTFLKHANLFIILSYFQMNTFTHKCHTLTNLLHFDISLESFTNKMKYLIQILQDHKIIQNYINRLLNEV